MWTKKAGNELGQAHLKLKIDFTLSVCRFGLSRYGLIVIIGWICFYDFKHFCWQI